MRGMEKALRLSHDIHHGVCHMTEQLEGARQSQGILALSLTDCVTLSKFLNSVPKSPSVRRALFCFKGWTSKYLFVEC